MKDVKRLRLPAVTLNRPKQCQVILADDPSWSITRKEAYSQDSEQHRRHMRNKPPGWDAQSCQRWAGFEVDGLQLCTIHAGLKCLTDRLGEEFPHLIRTNKD